MYKMVIIKRKQKRVSRDTTRAGATRNPLSHFFFFFSSLFFCFGFFLNASTFVRPRTQTRLASPAYALVMSSSAFKYTHTHTQQKAHTRHNSPRPSIYPMQPEKCLSPLVRTNLEIKSPKGFPSLPFSTRQKPPPPHRLASFIPRGPKPRR